MKKKLNLFNVVFIMLIISFALNVFQDCKIKQVEKNMDTLRDKYIELYERVEE